MSIINANEHGFNLPAGYTLAIVKNGEVIDSGSHIEQAAFNAAGDVYLNLMDEFIDTSEIKNKAQPA